VWLLPVACLFLAVWQYARRRTLPARLFAIALAVSMPVWTSSWLAAEMRVRTYPPEHDKSEFEDIKVRPATGQGYPEPGDIYGSPKNQVNIPVELSGWPRELVTILTPTLNVKDQGRFVAMSDLGMATRNDGHDWLIFRFDDLSRARSSAEKVELSSYLTLRIYESPGSTTLQPGGNWTDVFAFGNMKLLMDSSGRGRLLWRTLQPVTPGWDYELSDTKSKIVATGTWAGLTGGVSFFHLSFKLSPVFSYGTSFGMLPSGQPLTFTPKRPVGSIQRHLIIPQVRLADFETKVP
jgi:hypothetical protein